MGRRRNPSATCGPRHLQPLSGQDGGPLRHAHGRKAGRPELGKAIDLPPHRPTAHCAECGGAMVGQCCPSTRGGQKYVHRIYLCSHYLRGGKGACHWNGVNADDLDLAVALKVKARWLNRDLLNAVKEEIRRQDAAERGADPARLRAASSGLKAAQRKVEQAAARMLEEDEALLPDLRKRNDRAGGPAGRPERQGRGAGPPRPRPPPRPPTPVPRSMRRSPGRGGSTRPWRRATPRSCGPACKSRWRRWRFGSTTPPAGRRPAASS